MADTAGSDVSDGPVLNLINKRLRALRKKLNRITQMEESIAQGKTLNKEQEEVFRSKPSVTAAIDELEKLRQPLSVAVADEINLAVNCKIKNSTVDEEEKVVEGGKDEEGEKDEIFIIGELLKLVYFGCMFDVKTPGDYTSTMLTRTHERGCCLSYDYVSDDDATAPLVERDLDLISMVGSLLTSRPVDTCVSHKNALEKCVEHAKLWLSNSDQPIEPHSTVTYSALREKLAKIMSSPYFTTSPEMKAPEDVVAAATAGNYGSFQAQVEGLDVQYQHQEEDLAKYEGNVCYDDQASPLEEPHKVEFEAENPVDVPVQTVPVQTESVKAHAEEEQNLRDVETKDQQFIPRRRYQNQRGGRGAGGRRGSNNVRGGRNGGSRGVGAYQNGRGQYYDQPGNYYPRNYYNNRGRGGGSGAGGNSYNHGSAISADS